MSDLSQLDWVFVGCVVHSTVTNPMEIMDNTAIGVKHGKIVFVESVDSLHVAMKTHSMSQDRIVYMKEGQFLMPGFIDCHAHASQYSFMGTGTDLQLLDWLDKYTFPAESRVERDDDHGLAVYQKCVDRTLRRGSTTISYYATISRQSALALVDAIETQGQRAFVGKVNMDSNHPEGYGESREESIHETRQFVQELMNKKISTITPCITPTTAILCSMELMKDLSTIATKYNLPLQTHMCENRRADKVVNKLYPGIPSHTRVFDEAGVLGSKTMLAHAIHLSHQEKKLIKDRNAGICHCPNSNFTLTSGVMDLRHYMDMGIKVGLGTDFGAGSSPSMLDAIRRALEGVKVHDMKRLGYWQPLDVQTTPEVHTITDKGGEYGEIDENNKSQHDPPNNVHTNNVQLEMNVDLPPITYKHMFRLATLGSSQVMGLDDVIGNFEVNKEFDAILVDVNSNDSQIDTFPSDTTEDVIQKFIFLGDDRNISRVFVQGKEVIKPKAGL